MRDRELDRDLEVAPQAARRHQQITGPLAMAFLEDTRIAIAMEVVMEMGDRTIRMALDPVVILTDTIIRDLGAIDRLSSCIA